MHVGLGKAAAEIVFAGSILVGFAVASIPILLAVVFHWGFLLLLPLSPLAIKEFGKRGIYIHGQIKASLATQHDPNRIQEGQDRP